MTRAEREIDDEQINVRNTDTDNAVFQNTDMEYRTDIKNTDENTEKDTDSKYR